jgi:eukaryotic-like serine/threonine-protein kinase
LYRIMYGEADIAAVPDGLRPLVEAALAKDPQGRPTAQQLLDQLTSASGRTGRVSDAPTQVISSQIWQTRLYSRRPASGPDEASRALPGEFSSAAPEPPTAEPPTAEPPTADSPASLVPASELPAPESPAPEAPGIRKIPVGRRMATMAASALVAMRRRRPGRREAGRPRPK